MAELNIRGFGYLDLGGANRPFSIGLYQARVFCESFPEAMELGVYQELLGKLDLQNTSFETEETFRRFVFSALRAGAKKEKLSEDFSLDDVWFWLDEAPNSAILPFLKVVTQMSETAPVVGNDSGQPAKKTRTK
jgi:hypothetical protein